MDLLESLSSILSNWLYLDILSLLDAEPVLIWQVFIATAKSAIVESEVSPDLWDITAVYPALCAIFTASKVSERVPIWLTFIKIEFAMDLLIPLESRFTLVTNKGICDALLLIKLFEGTKISDLDPKLIKICLLFPNFCTIWL